MTGDYDRRIERAGELATQFPESAEILTLYTALARFQRSVFEHLRATEDTNPAALLPFVPALIHLLQASGTEPLRAFAQEPLHNPQELLQRYWEGDRNSAPEAQFFARVLLQPYAEYLASRGTPDMQTTAFVCPFCGTKPAVGVLRGEGEGAKRSLICSLCATEWPFRRVVCPNCGEEDKDKLPIYIAEQSPHLRLDACDACGSYFKSVDLTRNGHAVPIVDELASIALSIWADERGYVKAEPNLLGM